MNGRNTMIAKVEFVAEIGSNWYASGENGLERAKRLIESAAKNGADTVKFQLLRANQLYRDPKEQAARKHIELPIGWIPDLVKTSNDNGVEFLCTPFYPDAVDILAEHVTKWKIASWDMTYKPLLEKIAKTGMNPVMSTGAATLSEVEDALNVFLDYSYEADDITLLHCTGGYPTEPQDMVLNRINDLAAEFFPVHVGLSSHCVIPAVTASSVLFSAEYIEVHYDLKDRKGVESGHSYTPDKFSEMVRLAKTLVEAKDCGCERTFVDAQARNMYYRDSSDWLRPVLEPK